jgi:hypothetical protein
MQRAARCSEGAPRYVQQSGFINARVCASSLRLSTIVVLLLLHLSNEQTSPVARVAVAHRRSPD